MARIAGVDLPRDKKIGVALTYIFGIGDTLSDRILATSRVSVDTRVRDLNDQEVSRLREVIERDYTVEGELRRQVTQNIRRLIEIGSYRGIRHRRGLPVRGQRTSTNARTRKGPRKTVGIRRKA